MRKHDIAYILLAALLVGGVGYWIWSVNRADLPAPGSGSEIISGESKEYNSRELGLSFSYPKTYALYEKDLSVSRHEIALVEDTPENRMVMEGRSEIAREGPIAITATVYSGVTAASAEAWARSSGESNLLLGEGLFEPTTVDGKDGIVYKWSGLYEGESVVVLRGDKVYLFTSTYVEPTDMTVRDFPSVLSSVQLD